jgi:hypothetical protein
MPQPSKDEAETVHYHFIPCVSSPRPPSDISVDGSISYMFGPWVAELYFAYLFKGSIRRSLLCWDVPNWPGACFTSQGVLNAAAETSTCYEWEPKARLLDYDARNFEGTIVPQALWSPQSQGAMNKYVLDATLQFPIFFVRQDHTVGLPLHEAVEGPHGALLGAQTYAPLGGQSTHHVRIQVRVHCMISPPSVNVAVSPRPKGNAPAQLFTNGICGPSKWPGYRTWKRQVQARDDSRWRNPITLAKFAQHVGRCVSKFLQASIDL